MLGDSVDWDTNSHLLARVAHLLAGANWQRGGGKGQRPKPVKPPDSKPKRSRKSRQERGQDTARRLRNLGLLPGHAKPASRALTPQEQALADAIERARADPPEPVQPEAAAEPSEPTPAELQQRIDRMSGLD